jgi:hypothetical protein
VQFKDNGAPMGGPVTLVNGFASLFTSSLGAGPHNITAEFSGDGNFNPSSGSANQIVDKADTTTTLMSSPNPSNATHTVTFSVTVAQQFGGSEPSPSQKGR